MRIGLDFDGVLFDTERVFHAWATKIAKHGIVKPDSIFAQVKYGFDEKENMEYLHDLVKLTYKANIMPFADEILAKWIKAGHEIFIISSRAVQLCCVKEFIKGANDMLKKFGFSFPWLTAKREDTDFRLAVMDKAAICVENKIDILVEDNLSIVEKAAKAGVKCVHFCDFFGLKQKPLAPNPNIVRAENWFEIDAVVAEWQTRGFQKPVSNRAGSTPVHRTTSLRLDAVLGSDKPSKSKRGAQC